jgi:hypothetical protein
MRARTYKAAHRNLADSKRSIVMSVAGLAMILGTTSVGASMFSLNSDPAIIERTGSSVMSDANGENEVIIDEPAIEILQGQITGIVRKVHTALTTPHPGSTVQIGNTTVVPTLYQGQQGTGQQSGGSAAIVTPDPLAGGQTGDNQSGGSNPESGGSNGGETTDPGDTTGSGDSGGIVEDPDPSAPNQDMSQQNTSGDGSADTTPIQGS